MTFRFLVIIRNIFLAVFFAGTSTTPCRADGKIYYERVPASIPYQRALIIHSDGMETLVLQSQYKVPASGGALNLGWVVPLPSIPEVGSIPPNSADELFRNLDRHTYPRITYWRSEIGFNLLFFCPVLLLFILALSFLKSFARHKLALRRLSLALFIGSVALMLSAPLFIAQKKGVDGVEILRTQRAGIYDVNVVRSKTATGLISWLNDNRFQFDQNDIAAIRDHIDRGWCFVTAKVREDTDEPSHSGTTGKLLAPLVLQFPSANPIYPVALTASAGHNTEILLYLISEQGLSTKAPIEPGFRGRLENAQGLTGNIEFTMLQAKPESFGTHLFDRVSLPESGRLQKYKATMTPVQMAKDIEFHPSPNAPDFRLHENRW